MDLRLSRAVSAGLVLLLLVPTSLERAQSSPSQPFTPGETLTYDVDWAIFTAGRVVATLVDPGKNGGEPSEIVTTARSQGFASLLFKVDDEFDSHFNPQTFCSTRITKKISENRRHREIDLNFHPDAKIGVQEDRDLSKPTDPPKHTEIKIPGCVEDIVTAFYFLRHQYLRVGQDIHIALNDGGETHDVVIEVQAREQIQTALGLRMAFRLEPRVFGSLYKKKGRLLVWLSDDAEHLPLRIKMIISVGTFTANLKSVTNTPSSGTPAH